MIWAYTILLYPKKVLLRVENELKKRQFYVRIEDTMISYTQIQDEIKQSLRSKDELRLSVLRDIKTSLTNELVATGRKAQDIPDEKDVLKVIKRLAKQRKDSIEQFKAGKREDLAQKEEAELAILLEYLPEEMNDEEIESLVRRKIKELGVLDTSKMGILIGAVMKETENRADGTIVRQIVERVLSS